MGVGLDQINVSILNILQEDATLSTRDLAQKVGISQASCSRRVNRLRCDGYILRTVAILDPRKLSFKSEFFIELKADRIDNLNISSLSRSLRSFPEVIECHVVLGDFDFFLRVVAKDVESFKEFAHGRLSKLPGILTVVYYPVVSEVKATKSLPLLTSVAEAASA